MLKFITIGAVVFIVCFLGMMLASVIIGVDVTKDYKARNGDLVMSSNTSTILQTGQKFYNIKISLTTTLDAIKGLKSVKFVTKGEDGKDSTLQFNIISFYFIRGRNLTLYGHTHMATVMADGSVNVYPFNVANGKRSIEGVKPIRTEGNGSGSSTNPGFSGTEISSCEQLAAITQFEDYSLTGDLNCNFNAPLLPSGYSGKFDGHGNTITLNMTRDDSVALFASLKGAKIRNLHVGGTLSGRGVCGVFSVEVYPGTKFISSRSAAQITCSNVGTTDLSISGFSATVRNPQSSTDKIKWSWCVSENTYIPVVDNENVKVYMGDYFGVPGIGETAETVRKFCFSLSTNNNPTNPNFKHHPIGFKNHLPQNKTQDASLSAKTHVLPCDCYGYWDDTTADYINMCVGWYVEYYYEHQVCCHGFDSCPYVNCSRYEKVCMMCRPSKKKDENNSLSILPQVSDDQCAAE